MEHEFNENTKLSNRPARWKSFISVIAVVAIAFIAFRLFFNFFLIPILVVILLIADRDLVAKAIRFVLKQYKQATWKGLLATLAGFVLFFPLMGLLFARLVFLMFTDGAKEKQKSSISDSTLINIALEEKVKKLLQEKK